jgi:hypothetical protein
VRVTLQTAGVVYAQSGIDDQTLAHLLCFNWLIWDPSVLDKSVRLYRDGLAPGVECHTTWRLRAPIELPHKNKQEPSSGEPANRKFVDSLPEENGFENSVPAAS